MMSQYLLIEDKDEYFCIELYSDKQIYILGKCIIEDVGGDAQEVIEALEEAGPGKGYGPGEFTHLKWRDDNIVIITDPDIYGSEEQYTLLKDEFFKVLRAWDALIEKGTKNILITRIEDTFNVEEGTVG